MQLIKQTALVTGGSRGIGSAIAIALAEAGADVAILCLERDEHATQTLSAIEALGRRAVACYGDVSDRGSLAEAQRLVRSELGPLSIAVAGAAFSVREPFVEADPVQFRRTVDVTMWGAFHLLRTSAEVMIENQTHGSIVVISSPHAYAPYSGAMAYNMAKAAVDQMARTAAVELAPHRIRVNTIYPGWTRTPGEERFHTDEEFQRGAERLLWGRLGRPEEIGRAAVFLCDPASDYISGASLHVDAAQSHLRTLPNSGTA